MLFTTNTEPKAQQHITATIEHSLAEVLFSSHLTGLQLSRSQCAENTITAETPRQQLVPSKQEVVTAWSFSCFELPSNAS